MAVSIIVVVAVVAIVAAIVKLAATIGGIEFDYSDNGGDQ